MIDIQDRVKAIVANTTDSDGSPKQIRLEDICFKPLVPENPACAIESVTQFFQNDNAKLQKVTHDAFGGPSADFTSHLNKCL